MNARRESAVALNSGGPDLAELVSKIADHAATQPKALALDDGDATVSYKALWDLAGQLGARLATSSTRVGVCTGRTSDGPAAYLGVLAAGRSAVPLPSAAPTGRLRRMLTLSEVQTVIVDQQIPQSAVSLFEAERLDIVRLHSLSDRQAIAEPAPDAQEAYLLFTSGTTGEPKGVRISRAAVAAYLRHAAPSADLGPGCRVTNNFELTFDPSVFDVLATLTSGGTLVVPTRHDMLDPVSYVNKRRITHWYSVPSAISIARRMRMLSPSAMPGLRYSGFIGEALTLDQARAWAAASPNSVIQNVYGPTELTVSCAEYNLPTKIADWPDTPNGTVPIGSMYPELEWRLVEDGRISSTSGELCVKGAQRLMSYLDERDNTHRFYSGSEWGPRSSRESVPPEDHWYRTGDRVQMHQGQLLHIGRMDRQVKVRGYRVELSEIEYAARRVAGVQDTAAITAGNDDIRKLMLFYTGTSIPAAKFRQYLSDALPGYMLPQRIYHLDEMPLGERGKTDYIALRNLPFSAR